MLVVVAPRIPPDRELQKALIHVMQLTRCGKLLSFLCLLRKARAVCPPCCEATTRLRHTLLPLPNISLVSSLHQ